MTSLKRNSPEQFDPPLVKKTKVASPTWIKETLQLLEGKLRESVIEQDKLARRQTELEELWNKVSVIAADHAMQLNDLTQPTFRTNNEGTHPEGKDGYGTNSTTDISNRLSKMEEALHELQRQEGSQLQNFLRDLDATSCLQRLKQLEDNHHILMERTAVIPLPGPSDSVVEEVKNTIKVLNACYSIHLVRMKADMSHVLGAPNIRVPTQYHFEQHACRS